MGFTLRLFLLMTGIIHIDCQDMSDMKNLTRLLFSDYDEKIRPIKLQSSPMDVSVDFYLLSLNELDEVSETMKTTGYLSVSWEDEYLTWNPLDYGGLEYFVWPQDKVWKPDVSLHNSILEYKKLGIPSLNLAISHDGVVIWTPFEVFRSTCSMDITYFPFDVQTCYLTFGAWSYTNAEIIMMVGLDGLDLSKYSESSLWTIVGVGSTTNEGVDDVAVTFEIKAKRKPMFYLLNIILPIVLLAILNVSVFVLPCESGERAGFAITVFLALAVFLTVVSDTLPTNSETVAVFSVYLIIQTIQSTLITLVAMVTIRWSQNDDEVPIHPCLKALVRLGRCLCCTRGPKRTQVQHVPNDRTRYSSQRDEGKANGQAQHNSNAYVNPTSGLSPVKPTWKEAVRAFDVLLLIFFAMIFAISTVVCLTISLKG